MLMAISLALTGLFPNQALPELSAHEQDDADFAALMGLILGGMRLPQPTVVHALSAESMGGEVRTNIVLGDSSGTMLPGQSGESNLPFQKGSMAVQLTSQQVTAMSEPRDTTQEIELFGQVVERSITSVEGGVILPAPEDHSAVALSIEPAQFPLLRSLDAAAGDPSPSHEMINPGEGNGMIQVKDTLTESAKIESARTESAKEDPTTPSTLEMSMSIPEADSGVKEMSSSQAASSPSHSKSMARNADSSGQTPVNVAGTDDQPGAGPDELHRSATVRRSDVIPDADGPFSVSAPHNSESNANLRGDSSISAVSAVSGSLTTFHFAESITAEMREPLSTQVSRAVLDHLERPAAQDVESLRLRLDPPELGEMVIEVSRTREGLAIRVSAREAVTMEMLFSRGHEIESHLRGREVDLKSLEFLPSGSLGGQTSSEQHRHSASSQPDSVTSFRRSSRRSSATGVAEAQVASTGSESAHAFNFRA